VPSLSVQVAVRKVWTVNEPQCRCIKSGCQPEVDTVWPEIFCRLFGPNNINGLRFKPPMTMRMAWALCRGDAALRTSLVTMADSCM